MSEANLSHLADPGQIAVKQSAQEELATFRAIVAMLKKNPAKLRAATISAGIYTPEGKLTKAFGGHD